MISGIIIGLIIGYAIMDWLYYLWEWHDIQSAQVILDTITIPMEKIVHLVEWIIETPYLLYYVIRPITTDMFTDAGIEKHYVTDDWWRPLNKNGTIGAVYDVKALNCEDKVRFVRIRKD